MDSIRCHMKQDLKGKKYLQRVGTWALHSTPSERLLKFSSKEEASQENFLKTQPCGFSLLTASPTDWKWEDACEK